MKKATILNLVLLMLLLQYTVNTQSQTIQFQGSITSDTTWSADTLEITGDVIIDSNLTLTVQPGTFVHIVGYYAIWSYGSIRAIGTESDSIIFTHLDTLNHDDTSTIAGGWHGIRLLQRSSPDTSIFNYCEISNGKSVVPGSFYAYHIPENQGGNIYGINFGSIILSNCNISNGMVKCDGGGVYIENGDNVTIEHCDFKYNFAHYYYGGGVFIKNTEYVDVRNSLFYYNTCYNSDAISVGGQGSGIALQFSLGYDAFALIENNRFFNNKTGAGTIWDDYYNTTINGNIICNNFGSGIANAHMFNHAVYTNNTIVNNVSWIYAGITTTTSDISLINNIVRGNCAYPNYPIDQIFHFEITPPPDVSYCNVEFGYEGEGNIDSLPMFVNPTAGSGLDYNGADADWSLLVESPCINTGTPDTTGLFLPDYDIEGNPRICGFRIDMGAYENQVFAVTEPVLQENIFTSVFPNPGTNHLNIKTKFKNSTFELIDFTGKIIIRKFLNTFTKQINTSNIPPGMYFYRINDNEKIIESGKWVKR